MKFNDLMKDIEKLVGIELHAIDPSTANIILESVDLTSDRYIVKSHATGKSLKRNLKELRLIFDDLIRNGYCIVEQILQGSNLDFSQPETIFANLPYVQYLKIDGRKHIIFRNIAHHQYGELQEVSSKEQKNVRSIIAAHKRISINDISNDLINVLQMFKEDILNLDVTSPGVLVDSNIRDNLKELERIELYVQNANLIRSKFDLNIVQFEESLALTNSVALSPRYSIFDSAYNNNFDLSNLADLPQVTGIDEGNNSLDTDIINNLEENEQVSINNIPNIRRQTPSLALLYDRLHYKEIEIQPAYQRKDRIWDNDRKSKLIESILMGLPLPIFYFGERKNDNWVVIDGLQRLTTIQDFMKNDFQLKLEKDSSVYEVNGLTFRDFDRKFTRALREYEITAYVIDIDEESNQQKIAGTNRFIIELFHRINTYGVKLSEQEIRSAINFGNSVFYLKNLSTSPIFTNATNNTVNPKRQKDLELCLGAISFIIFGFKDYNKNNYSDFLSEAMIWINKQNFQLFHNRDGEENYKSISPVIDSLTERFENSLCYCKKLFGTNAFKKSKDSTSKDPISKPLFETLVTIFANATDDQKAIILHHKENFLSEFFSAIEIDSQDHADWASEAFKTGEPRGLRYALSTSTGKRITILYRFEAILKMLNKTTACNIEIIPLSKMDLK